MHKDRIKAVICWALTVICMIIIYWLSSRTAAESSAQSTGLLERLIAIFGDNFFTDHIVRKMSHFLEFAGLSLLFNISICQTRKKADCIISVALTSLYAITDEFHQLFVAGRSCQFSDWCIDTFGAIIGAMGFLVIYSTVKAISKKKMH